MSQRKFITDENLKRFASNVKNGIATLHEDIDADLGNIAESIKKAQDTADAAKSAAATAQSTANSKLSSVKTINGVSLVGTGNVELSDLGIDGNIFKVVDKLPEVSEAEQGKVYLVKKLPDLVDGTPAGDNSYVEWIVVEEITGGVASTGKLKWEKLGEYKLTLTVDSALSDTSTNPVQNKVVNNALTGKVDKVSGKQLSTNDYTTTEKNKLAGIATGATKVVVDTKLTQNSANAAQSGAVYAAVAACFKEADFVELTNDDIDTLWSQATAL